MRIVQSYARIESMEQYYATVGSEGELEIPVAICESLGIVDGTRVAICVEGDRIILQPETRLAEQRTIKE
jgi:bifunctional DNA-binding transcriptional regulator/antitoxin component of YhaV-PrlF toxin-antitoxin module